MTFGTMVTRIGLETRRITGFTAHIQDAIKSAIKHYEGDTFQFNQERSTATALTSQDMYALPVGFKELRSITVTVNSNTYTLKERSYDEMERRHDPNNKSDPRYYSIYDSQLRLQPIPSQTAVMCMSYQKELTAVSATSDTNAWFVEGENLIRAKAKAYFWRDVLQSEAKAATFDIQAAIEKKQLEKRDANYTSQGNIQPWL